MKSTNRIATLMAGLSLIFVYASTARADCGVDLFSKLPAAAALRAPLPTTAMLSSNQQDDKSWFKDDDAGPFGLRIVGLWSTTVTQGQTVLLRGFDVYHSDHTEVLNEFHDPRTGNVCLGVWKYVGHNTYKLKHPAFLWDANGVWIGYRILHQTVTLAADGNSFTGTWSNDRTDINGNIVSHIDADIAGTRVEVDY
jgi:hypothetical protein